MLFVICSDYSIDKINEQLKYSKLKKRFSEKEIKVDQTLEKS